MRYLTPFDESQPFWRIVTGRLSAPSCCFGLVSYSPLMRSLDDFAYASCLCTSFGACWRLLDLNISIFTSMVNQQGPGSIFSSMPRHRHCLARIESQGSSLLLLKSWFIASAASSCFDYSERPILQERTFARYPLVASMPDEKLCGSNRSIFQSCCLILLQALQLGPEGVFELSSKLFFA